MRDDSLLEEMERYFGEDDKRITHARRVTHYVKELLMKEPAARPEVVIPAAILHDIGIHEAERKYGSTAGHYQEIEGPPIARDILRRHITDEGLIDEICEIIAHHHSPGRIDSINFKLVYDADWLVNLGDEVDISDKARLQRLIEKIFLTPAGKDLARKVYLATS